MQYISYIYIYFTHLRIIYVDMSMQHVTLYNCFYIINIYIYIFSLKLKICESTSRYRYTHLYRSIQYPHLTSKHVDGCTFDFSGHGPRDHTFGGGKCGNLTWGKLAPKRPIKQLLMLHDMIFSLEKKMCPFGTRPIQLVSGDYTVSFSGDTVSFSGGDYMMLHKFQEIIDQVIK